MMLSKVKGVIVPLITPFDEQGNIMTDALKAHIEFLISHGVHGLFPGGTTGEGPLLTIKERCFLAEAIVDFVKDHIPVIIHTEAARPFSAGQISGTIGTISVGELALPVEVA